MEQIMLASRFSWTPSPPFLSVTSCHAPCHAPPSRSPVTHRSRAPRSPFPYNHITEKRFIESMMKYCAAHGLVRKIMNFSSIRDISWLSEFVGAANFCTFQRSRYCHKLLGSRPVATKPESLENASEGLSDNLDFVENGRDPTKLWPCLWKGKKFVASTLMRPNSHCATEYEIAWN